MLPGIRLPSQEELAILDGPALALNGWQELPPAQIRAGSDDPLELFTLTTEAGATIALIGSEHRPDEENLVIASRLAGKLGALASGKLVFVGEGTVPPRNPAWESATDALQTRDVECAAMVMLAEEHRAPLYTAEMSDFKRAARLLVAGFTKTQIKLLFFMRYLTKWGRDPENLREDIDLCMKNNITDRYSKSFGWPDEDFSFDALRQDYQTVYSRPFPDVITEEDLSFFYEQTIATLQKADDQEFTIMEKVAREDNRIRDQHLARVIVHLAGKLGLNVLCWWGYRHGRAVAEALNSPGVWHTRETFEEWAQDLELRLAQR